MRALLLLAQWPLLAPVVQAIGFENNPLTAEDVKDIPALQFGDQQRDRGGDNGPECKAFPGTSDWPSEREWRQLNNTLDGGLLNPMPAAAACYDGPLKDPAKCAFLVNEAGNTHYWIDDPLNTLTQWMQGSTCMPSLNATGSCTRGGFPEYVVNVTRVRHVQAAINFARNKNVRLVVKNTGHDFGGRNLGAGSLSIWTHNLKGFEFLPKYTKGEYSGMAVVYGAGLEAWEVYNLMLDYNITLVAAGGRTVGHGGGWFALGGHGNLASTHGLGSDQALEIHVVTPDGRFIAASEDENSDLFYALRGGGGSTYGVITSVIAKAYPPIEVVRQNLNFTGNANANESAGWSFNTNDTAVFWKGIEVYLRFTSKIVDTGGVDWSYLTPIRNGTYTWRVFLTWPGKTVAEVTALVKPLYDELNKVGVKVPIPDITSGSYAQRAETAAAPLANTRYRSRLFPRKNWDTEEAYQKTYLSIRSACENGFTFHGLAMKPSKQVAGWPGRTSSVNPAWRNNALNSYLMSTQPVNYTPQQARDEESRIQRAMDVMRAASPGAGSYMNEGDPGEPNWQQSFFGDEYPRLLRVKRKYDPWGVFWATTTVGSEGWEVRSQDGYPRSQNGRLCRVGRSRE